MPPFLQIDGHGGTHNAQPDKSYLCHIFTSRIDDQINICTARVPLCRSEEHTSELQSLMRISYAVFCLKKKKNCTQTPNTHSIRPPQITSNRQKPIHSALSLHDQYIQLALK